LDAGTIVLAEFCDTVVGVVRDREDEWIADVRRQAAAAQDKRREAAKLMAEAQAEEFRAYKLAQWVLATADDGPFGRTPAPEVVPAPKNWTMPAHGLERPWHRERVVA
jgi:hypothetical protein